MKKILLLIAVLFSINSFSQEITYKEYSYTEFFNLIEEEKDSVFKLSDAIIKFNKKTDSIYGGIVVLNTQKINYYRKKQLLIDKELQLTNVQFIPFFISSEKINNNLNLVYASGFNHILFKKEVHMVNSIAYTFADCIFEEPVSFSINSKINKIHNYFLENLYQEKNGQYSNISYSDMMFQNDHFKKGISLNYNAYYTDKVLSNVNLTIDNCIMRSIERFDNSDTFIRNLAETKITNSTYESNFNITAYNNRFFYLEKSLFKKRASINFNSTKDTKNVSIIENKFLANVLLDANILNDNINIDWKQWQNKVINEDSYMDYLFDLRNEKKFKEYNPVDLSKILNTDSIYNIFKKEHYLISKSSLKGEFKLRTKFLQFYRDNYEFDNANLVYLEYKDIETKRSEIEYRNNPTFDNFFSWRINQFLKIFSAYGTKPSKAVTFSFYVILLFAFIYLLFPNSWDSHGKNRIMDRYRFFTKYMNKEAGIHDVYLDEQRDELLESEDFKTYMLNAEKNIPKFFIATALPLYKWSVSGTKISAYLLKRVDIMKGTWNELPQSKRIWKSVLLITFFLIAILYDIFIKMLNALMLSINTFTTLGFGEIPIKGLPRYLAIIQGFIGWFMLTIFSVSLISQLLN